MENYNQYISPNRQCVSTPRDLIKNGKAVFGTFDKEFETMELLNCNKPAGKLFPEFLKKFREENKKLEDDKLNVPVKEVKDLSDDSSLIEEVEKEVKKPKKRTVKKPAAKKEVKSEE